MVVTNSKVNNALDSMLSREDYLVTQGNDLARSFGNLSAFQHKVLDFCFSYVQANDDSRKMYQSNLIDILHHLGLNASGFNYKRVVVALKSLDLKTSIYLRTVENDGTRGILMTHLFDHVKILENGKFEFRFSEDVTPYVFQLKKNFYSFKLAELVVVRSKYTLTLMKLWNAKGHGTWKPTHNQLPDAVIEGALEDWEAWFLGSDDDGKPKRWTASRFRQQVLTKAINELDRLYPRVHYALQVIKNGRKVTGYRLEIHPIQTNLSI